MKKTIVIVYLCVIFQLTTNAQWQEVKGPYGGGDIYCIEKQGNEIYVGAYQGLYKSIDNGVTWSVTSIEHPTYSIVRNDSIIIIACGTKGIYRSTDKGKNWITNGIGLPEECNSKIMINTETELYLVISGDNIYKSIDNGTTWMEAISVIENEYINSIEIIDSNIYLATSNGIFFSNNNGVNWEMLDSGVTYAEVNDLLIIDSTIFSATGDGLFISKDHGKNWMPSDSGFPDNYGKMVEVIEKVGSDLYAGTYNHGIYKSVNDGISWNSISNGFKSYPTVENLYYSQIQTLNFEDSILFIGANDGLYKSSDTSYYWNIIGVKDADVWTLISDDSNLYIGTGYGVFKSIDNGNTWKSKNNGLSNISVYSLAIKNNNIYAGTENGVYYSNNLGESWISANNGIENYSIEKIKVYNKCIFAMTFNSSGTYLSTDNGKDWREIDSSLNVNFTSVAVMDSIFYASSIYGVCYSNDSGYSWTYINDGIREISISDIIIDDTILYAAGFLGIYKSTNNGRQWNTSFDGSGQYSINSLLVNDNKIYASGSHDEFVLISGSKWYRIDKNDEINMIRNLLCIHNNSLYIGCITEGLYKKSFLNVVNDDTICPGDTAILSTLNIFGEGDNMQYKWSNGAITSSIKVTPNLTSSYTVRIMNDTLSDSTQSNVIVKYGPLISINGVDEICYGNSTTLTAKGADSYIWNTGDTSASIEINPILSTAYFVTGLDSLTGCKNEEYTIIYVKPNPSLDLGNDTVIYANSSLLLFPGYYDEYLWTTGKYYSNSPGVIVDTSIFDKKDKINIYLTVWNDQCYAKDTLVVSLISSTKILSDYIQAFVYPNPVIDILSIDFDNYINNIEITIYSINGDEVYNYKGMYLNRHKINLEKLQKGYYILEIISNGYIYRQKIIKQ